MELVQVPSSTFADGFDDIFGGKIFLAQILHGLCAIGFTCGCGSCTIRMATPRCKNGWILRGCVGDLRKAKGKRGAGQYDGDGNENVTIIHVARNEFLALTDDSMRRLMVCIAKWTSPPIYNPLSACKSVSQQKRLSHITNVHGTEDMEHKTGFIKLVEGL